MDQFRKWDSRKIYWGYIPSGLGCIAAMSAASLLYLMLHKVTQGTLVSARCCRQMVAAMWERLEEEGFDFDVMDIFKIGG